MIYSFFLRIGLTPWRRARIRRIVTLRNIRFWERIAWGWMIFAAAYMLAHVIIAIYRGSL